MLKLNVSPGSSTQPARATQLSSRETHSSFRIGNKNDFESCSCIFVRCQIQDGTSISPDPLIHAAPLLPHQPRRPPRGLRPPPNRLSIELPDLAHKWLQVPCKSQISLFTHTIYSVPSRNWAFRGANQISNRPVKNSARIRRQSSGDTVTYQM